MANKTYSNKKKAPKMGKKAKQERPEYEYDIHVLRVFAGRYGTLFDVEINHVTIYGCRVCETRDGTPFVGFPQKKDRKEDKYWSVARAWLNEDQTAEVMRQVADLLEYDEDEEDE